MPRRDAVIAAKSKRAWSTGVFDCTSDQDTCFRQIFCGRCIIAQKLTEFQGSSCCVHFFLQDICCCSAIQLRTAARTRWDISGNDTDDCMLTMCCQPCAVCQIMREEKMINLGQTVQQDIKKPNSQQMIS